ncbi:hypothetical protein CO058_02750 [candidate division WWE3 bacterium CG_4_9_14_0_2_um_filter_35_11]|uniref:EamA domain-containing protein n=1 Tax=candidate division WWE3 bacterium CG_4_9_14_0_2_um_filter_35_11 TaxID=1975077 RepID=A0A2M8ELG8_UNCKA|nr:MAG: hypothetical protein CO058_02750 [candidate division WWE3 bacterium CG_4_9_14_0_2_um_filter_35_11]
MNWIIYAIIPAFLWAIVNHIDKYLIEKYYKGIRVGSLVIFSSLIGLPVSILIYLFNQSVFEIPIQQILLIVFAGISYIIGVVFYLYALSKDEASTIVPNMMLVPSIGAILSYFFLGESLSHLQVFAIFLVIFGALLISSDLKDLRFPKLKPDVFLLMVCFAFFMSLNAIIFKYAMIVEYDFWVIAFWEHIGFLALGIFCLAFINTYRVQFWNLVKKNSFGIISLNTLNESITISGNLIFHYAIFLAPVAIVESLTEGVQPVFVLAIAIFLTLFFPKLGKEELTKKILIQKFFAIIIMFIGIHLLD